MADETIRSLIVKLEYDVDSTGADRFKSSFKQLSDSINRLASNVEKNLSPKKLVKIGPLERRVRLLGKRFKKSLRQALRLSPSQFKALESDLKFIGKNVKKAFDKAKVAALAGAAALAAVVTKSFKGFANVEQARLALEFRVGDGFEEVLERINKVRESTGNVVSELEALNALNLGVDIAGDLDGLIDNFDDVIKLSKILGKDVGEVQQAFATFITTGSNLQELVKFGFFTPEQIEALQKQGTDLGAQGISARRTQLQAKIQERQPEIQEKFNRFLSLSNATLDRLGTSAEDASKAIGERLNPAINEAAKTLTGAFDDIRRRLEKGESLFDALTAPGGAKNKEGTTNQNQNISNVTNITNNVSGVSDPEQAAAEVERKLAKKINQNTQRRTVPQSLNTTIQPAQ